MQKIIGFTAGVFDMFHIGHLNLINNARARCDYLIVGVNSDELVQKYKRKTAVVPFDERVQIISSIKGVDETLRIDTLDKLDAWNRRPFDLLFIGNDWKGSDRWTETEKIMAEHNVRVIYLPYTQGTTSTLLREKLSEY